MSIPTQMHSIERTSPKGEAFIGRCVQCGIEGLTFRNMEDKCFNTKGLTQEEALLWAISGDNNE